MTERLLNALTVLDRYSQEILSRHSNMGRHLGVMQRIYSLDQSPPDLNVQELFQFELDAELPEPLKTVPELLSPAPTKEIAHQAAQHESTPTDGASAAGASDTPSNKPTKSSISQSKKRKQQGSSDQKTSVRPPCEISATNLNKLPKWSKEVESIPRMERIIPIDRLSKISAALTHSDRSHWYCLSGANSQKEETPISVFADNDSLTSYSIHGIVGKVVARQLRHPNKIRVGTNGSINGQNAKPKSSRPKSVRLQQIECPHENLTIEECRNRQTQIFLRNRLESLEPLSLEQQMERLNVKVIVLNPKQEALPRITPKDESCPYKANKIWNPQDHTTYPKPEEEPQSLCPVIENVENRPIQQANVLAHHHHQLDWEREEISCENSFQIHKYMYICDNKLMPQHEASSRPSPPPAPHQPPKTSSFRLKLRNKQDNKVHISFLNADGTTRPSVMLDYDMSECLMKVRAAAAEASGAGGGSSSFRSRATAVHEALVRPTESQIRGSTMQLDDSNFNIDALTASKYPLGQRISPLRAQGVSSTATTAERGSGGRGKAARGKKLKTPGTKSRCPGLNRIGQAAGSPELSVYSAKNMRQLLSQSPGGVWCTGRQSRGLICGSSMCTKFLEPSVAVPWSITSRAARQPLAPSSTHSSCMVSVPQLADMQMLASSKHPSLSKVSIVSQVPVVSDKQPSPIFPNVPSLKDSMDTNRADDDDDEEMMLQQSSPVTVVASSTSTQYSSSSQYSTYNIPTTFSESSLKEWKPPPRHRIGQVDEILMDKRKSISLSASHEEEGDQVLPEF